MLWNLKISLHLSRGFLARTKLTRKRTYCLLHVGIESQGPKKHSFLKAREKQKSGSRSCFNKRRRRRFNVQEAKNYHYHSSVWMLTDGGETKAPSATFHSVAPPDLDCATISICPLIGRLNCCPLAARYFWVPLCFSLTALSRRHWIKLSHKWP